MRAKRNKCKIVATVQMFIFMWRFIYRSRRGCLNSLMTVMTMTATKAMMMMRRIMTNGDDDDDDNDDDDQKGND